ncbi:Uu.00g039280.m01.CDS01 [Anthostomella pinea]|uniref:Uu.00g039280.m01.CDS01 n=1 Tax=Anthostomella pinea TaxID=933095 RepID=A0AAI8YDT6_9PEZI|nr:Uu.00g039280.m01.CDS01 [Anthostomella pinea]
MAYQILGKDVSKIGFGMMSLTQEGTKTQSTDDEKFAILKAALAAGSNSWNGGEFYGPNLEDNSLPVLRKYFEKYPEDAGKVCINIKGGAHKPPMTVDNSPEYVRQSVQHCVDQLGGKAKIDMWEMCRRVSQGEYLESLRVIDGFVKEGTIGGVALTEVNANTIRQAAKIVKVAAVEVEISLFETEPLHNGICEACVELGIPIYAYSPLGRGFLTGKPFNPLFKMLPRLADDNIAANTKLVEAVKKWAAKKDCTPAQFAINWVATLSQRPGMPKIIPIPGAAHIDRVKENLREVELTDADMDEVDAFLVEFKPAGERLPAFFAQWLDTNESTEV